jgi:hypothetical protein
VGLDADKKVRADDLRHRWGVTERRARRDVAALKERAIIAFVGPFKKGGYRLVRCCRETMRAGMRSMSWISRWSRSRLAVQSRSVRVCVGDKNVDAVPDAIDTATLRCRKGPLRDYGFSSVNRTGQAGV